MYARPELIVDLIKTAIPNTQLEQGEYNALFKEIMGMAEYIDYVNGIVDQNRNFWKNAMEEKDKMRQSIHQKKDYRMEVKDKTIETQKNLIEDLQAQLMDDETGNQAPKDE